VVILFRRHNPRHLALPAKLRPGSFATSGKRIYIRLWPRRVPLNLRPLHNQGLLPLSDTHLLPTAHGGSVLRLSLVSKHQLPMSPSTSMVPNTSAPLLLVMVRMVLWLVPRYMATQTIFGRTKRRYWRVKLLNSILH